MLNEEPKKNPLRKLIDFRKEEMPVVLLMFTFFFLVIAIFQLLRPLKKGLFVDTLGADIELYAKLTNILISAAGVWVYTFLVNHLQRQKVIYALCFFFAGCFVVLSHALLNPSNVSIWSFYLLGDLLSTMMVTGFWAYLTDISNSDQAKRLYGVIGAGGVLGGWVGVSVSKFLLHQLQTTGLLLLAAGLVLVLAVIVFVLERWIHSSGMFGTESKPLARPAEGKTGNPAIEGARLAMRSRYLATIVGLMALYEIGSQVNDYEFSKYSETLNGVLNTQAFMTNVAFYANALAVVVQLFLVSLIMRKLGVKAALLVLPVAMMFSSMFFLLIPGAFFASLLFISDNGLNYSIQQTSRESLYVVTTPDEKYKARAFTNMFVQRLAKGIAIFAVIGLGLLGFTGASVRYFGVITMAMMLAMVFLSIYAGNKFVQKLQQQEAPPTREAAYRTA